MVTEEQALEKIRNKEWRMNHLYKIQTKDAKLIQFKRNLAQWDFARQRTKRDILLKARQLGFTTECTLNMLDETLTNANTSSAIIAHERQKVTIIFEMVRRAFDNFPDELKPRVSFDNRNELYFPDLDSKIFVTLDTRGETIHNLHVSEVAFLEKAESRMTGILESVPKTGKITFESTANGASGYYYDTWEDPNSEFKKHFYNWLWDVDYQEECHLTLDELQGEYREQVKRYGLIPDLYEKYNLTKEQFYFYIKKVRRHKNMVVQEYPTSPLEAFISSGRNIFHVSDLSKHDIRSPIDRRWNDLEVWEEPINGFRYVIGCDVAEGLGGDYSVIEVFNADTGDQAAEFVSNAVAPDRLGDYLVEVGKWYNNAFLNIEVNNHGRATIDHIKHRYYNIYRRKVFDKVTNSNTEALGWRTTGVTKPLLVDNLEQAIREQSIHIHSRRSINEMRIFVQTEESGKQGFGAEGSGHDDTVIANGLALQAIKNLPRAKKPETIAEQKLKKFMEKNAIPTYMKDDYVITNRNRPHSVIRKERYGTR